MLGGSRNCSLNHEPFAALFVCSGSRFVSFMFGNINGQARTTQKTINRVTEVVWCQ